VNFGLYICYAIEVIALRDGSLVGGEWDGIFLEIGSMPFISVASINRISLLGIIDNGIGHDTGILRSRAQNKDENAFV